MNPLELLDAVLQYPERVAPRLVLADALMKQADPRGEFIAAQCLGDDARAQALLADHGKHWLEGLFSDECNFVWGFPEDVFLAGSRIETQWAEVVRRVPVRRAQLAGLTVQTLRRILEMPGVERLTTLDLSRGALGAQGATMLATCDRLRHLEALRLCSCGIDAEGALALANSQHLSALQRLDLSANPLGGAGVHALTVGPGLAAVQQMRAFRVGADTRPLEARFGPPCAPGPGLLCVELPAWVQPRGLALGQLSALEVNQPRIAGIELSADLMASSILGGRKNSSYLVDEDGRAWVTHLGHSLHVYVNGQPMMNRLQLAHGDLIEMPYRSSFFNSREAREPVRQHDLDLRRGLGLVYVGPCPVTLIDDPDRPVEPWRTNRTC